MVCVGVSAEEGGSGTTNSLLESGSTRDETTSIQVPIGLVEGQTVRGRGWSVRVLEPESDSVRWRFLREASPQRLESRRITWRVKYVRVGPYTGCGVWGSGT